MSQPLTHDQGDTDGKISRDESNLVCISFLLFRRWGLIAWTLRLIRAALCWNWRQQAGDMAWDMATPDPWSKGNQHKNFAKWALPFYVCVFFSLSLLGVDHMDLAVHQSCDLLNLMSIRRRYGMPYCNAWLMTRRKPTRKFHQMSLNLLGDFFLVSFSLVVVC